MTDERTVYVVDDDPPVVTALAALLTSYGLKVLTCQSAEEFLAAYDGSREGCLVLDVRLPKMNGLELQEWLAAEGHEIPVVFISGDAVAVSQLQELAPRAVGVTVKEGIWNRAVVTMSPDSARAAIRQGVARVVGALPAPSPRPVPPFEVELEYSSAIFADVAEGIPGIRRVGPTTVGFTVDTYPEAYRMIRVLYKHLQP